MSQVVTWPRVKPTVGTGELPMLRISHREAG